MGEALQRFQPVADASWKATALQRSRAKVSLDDVLFVRWTEFDVSLVVDRRIPIAQRDVSVTVEHLFSRNRIKRLLPREEEQSLFQVHQHGIAPRQILVAGHRGRTVRVEEIYPSIRRAIQR